MIKSIPIHIIHSNKCFCQKPGIGRVSLRLVPGFFVWEQIHNKPLPQGWVIHHLNGNGTDNRPENLVAMPNKKHIRLIPIYRERIRILEAKVKKLERAFDSQQMIWWGVN